MSLFSFARTSACHHGGSPLSCSGNSAQKPVAATGFSRLVPPRALSFALTATLSLGLAAGLLGTAPAQARPEMAGQTVASRFEAMDTNKDGKVTREEFFAAQPQMKDAAFLAIDTDKSDNLSLEEWEAFASGHGKSMGKEPGMSMGKEPAMGMGGAAQPSGTDPEQPAPSAKKTPDLIMPPPATKQP